MWRLILLSIVVLLKIQAQNEAFPLESVTVEGTATSREVVLDISGLHLGSPVDKAAMDRASQKLNDSGLFESVNYSYAPGPHQGYALALQVTDPRNLINASIDIPGVNEDQLWMRLASRYPSLNHRVPANDAAQHFVAQRLEEQLGAALEGHHIIGQLESDLKTGKASISFQPDPLPRIVKMNFTGQGELTAEQLSGLIPKDVRQQGYSDRSFRTAIELNLRRAYEERGMYRVRFPEIAAQREPDWAISVTTSIEEGAKFTLGQVQILGDNLPVDVMLKAAKFRKGELANWTEIQNSIWELEKPVKRLGYLNAAAKPERILHDERHVLDLNLSISRGPLFRFGQLHIVGLAPNLEAEARKLWGLNSGDPFDYEYSTDFFRAFFKAVDSRQFKKYNAQMQKSAGENVMDFTLIFDSR